MKRDSGEANFTAVDTAQKANETARGASVDRVVGLVDVSVEILLAELIGTTSHLILLFDADEFVVRIEPRVVDDLGNFFSLKVEEESMPS